MDVPKSRVKLSFKVLSPVHCTSLCRLVGVHLTCFFFVFQCFDLVDKDLLSKSDPIVILQEKKKPEDPWTFVGRTEYIKDNQNPSFDEKITLVCKFIARSFEKIAVMF